MTSANEDTQLDAIQDIRAQLAQTFNEALQTHGAALTMTAAVTFAASACHHAEHMIAAADSAPFETVLQHWEDGFYGYLTLLNRVCGAK